MISEVKTYTYPGGDIQRVHMVKADSFSSLEFYRPGYDPDSFRQLCELYSNFLVPAAPPLFGQLVLFRLPEDLDLPDHVQTERGTVYDPLVLVKQAFKKHVRVDRNGNVRVSDEKTRALWDELEARGCIHIARGKRSYCVFLPVGNDAGFLSAADRDAQLKVNASFFVMNCFDVSTVFDVIGTPLGLCVKDGAVENPPLFGREVLSVGMDGKARVTHKDIRELTVCVGGKEYTHGINCRIFDRPESRKTCSGGYDIVITGKKVLAVLKGGRCPVPASGFVIHTTEDPGPLSSAAVTYSGMEDTVFAVQVGNSCVVDGVKTDRFISRFHRFLALHEPSYPPALYPSDYRRSRAPRAAIGADADGRPMILWFEGKAKTGYVRGTDSCGASLSEVAEICADLGMVNGVNLDGGGSAQILLDGKRSLLISDRDPADNSEAERAVPMGIIIY